MKVQQKIIIANLSRFVIKGVINLWDSIIIIGSLVRYLLWLLKLIAHTKIILVYFDYIRHLLPKDIYK